MGILDLIFNFKFLFIYITVCFLSALFIYNKALVFLKPKTHLTQEGEEKNIHESYEEWRKYDKNYYTFSRLFLGFIFLVWFKLLFVVLMIILFYFYLKIILKDVKSSEKSISQEIRNKITFGSKIIISLTMMGLGLFKFNFRKNQDWEKIYQEKLGEDYFKINRNKYSIIISNHTSWMDMFIYSCLLTPGFVAKKSVLDVPFIGFIAKSIGSIFIDRGDTDSRHLIGQMVHERQLNFLQNKDLTPPFIFPEGTNSNGQLLLTFKKGAFASLLPVKPYLIKLYPEDFSISEGCLDTYIHVFYSLCFLYHNFDLLELPVIEPTEEMYRRYVGDKKEKWEIFAEVTREIYCKIGGLRMSNKNYQDGLDYVSLIKNTTIKSY